MRWRVLLRVPGYRVISESLLREPLAGTTVHTLPGIPGHLRHGFRRPSG